VLALASASRSLPWGHPLLYDWSAEGQKLYAWLRLRAEQRAQAIADPLSRALPLASPEPVPDDPARAVDGWRARGYVATYATSEQIMESVLPVSRNTVTKLVAELLDRRVCVPRRVRRGGHVFLLGEWGLRRSALLDAELYWQCYYLDGILGASEFAVASDAGASGKGTGHVARGLVPRRHRADSVTAGDEPPRYENGTPPPTRPETSHGIASARGAERANSSPSASPPRASAGGG